MMDPQATCLTPTLCPHPAFGLAEYGQVWYVTRCMLVRLPACEISLKLEARRRRRGRRDGGETKAEMAAMWKEGRPHGGDDEGEQ